VIYIKKLPVKTFAIVGVLALSLVFTQPALAAHPAGNNRPGWGHGDNNHVHTGPPGQSVRPPHNNGHNNVTNNIQVIVNNTGKGVVNVYVTIVNFFHGKLFG